ncbi:MAG TPA: hypothetical protein VE988_04665 [Gemmataceae bacterium]|nr:hypothetical protein [Gemmataceae bacterium]
MHVETLLAKGKFAASKEWAEIWRALHKAIKKVDWPPGSGKFTIHPQSGKKRGEGNGVTPIKERLLTQLRAAAWTLEEPLEIAAVHRPGKIDAILYSPVGQVAVEWETGNVSSSHRALNKMALGSLKKKLVAGSLIVPSRKLYAFLTDRVGNWDELAPYIDLWKSIPVTQGVLEIVVVEHDATSTGVPRIPKGTDGRAIG